MMPKEDTSEISSDNNDNRDVPERETIFMVPVLHWSDGTAAPHEALD